MYNSAMVGEFKSVMILLVFIKRVLKQKFLAVHYDYELI